MTQAATTKGSKGHSSGWVCPAGPGWAEAMEMRVTSLIVVSQELMTFTPDISIQDAANRLIAESFQQAPVVSAVDSKRLVGVITLNNITRQ